MTDSLSAGGPATSYSPRRRARRLLFLLAVIAVSFVCDQATKKVAEAELPPGRRISLLSGSIRLEQVRNSGAFLSMGARLSPVVRRGLFTWGVAALVLAALVYAFHPRTANVPALGAALVAGGGLGNLWDRVMNGGLVTDFMNLGLGQLRTGIFNVADMVIMAGVLVLALRPGGGKERSPAPPNVV
jgi:signal peptidase II